MKTKKLTLKERLEEAQDVLHLYQRLLAIDLINNHTPCAEYDMKRIKQYANYIKNTCKMHDIEYIYLL